MDKDLYWLRDQEAMENIRVFWRPGPANNADYHTKNHPGVHHEAKRTDFLTPINRVESLCERLARRVKGEILPQ